MPHQYAKPGLYTVVAPITEIPTQFSELCNPDDTYQDVVEFPANGECNVATASRSSVESSRKKLPEFKPPQECLPPKEDCVVSFFGAFCLVDKKLKDAYDKYKDLKEKYEEAKKIVDPKERKKALKEIAEEKNVAKEEYKKLLEDSKEQAKENAKKLNLPQEKMGKKINKALRGL